MKILKIFGELFFAAMFKSLYILTNYSISYLSAWPRDRAGIFGGKFVCFED